MINQMHRKQTKNYCLGCSPKLMDLAIKMINYHIDKIKETKMRENAPHKIFFRNRYPTFSFNDRLPENEFHCNLAGWDNAQKLDFKALPWNNERHDKPQIIPLDTVFNFNTLVVINNWVTQFMWSRKMFGYCSNCSAEKDKEVLKRLQTLFAFNVSYQENESSSLQEKYIPRARAPEEDAYDLAFIGDTRMAPMDTGIDAWNLTIEKSKETQDVNKLQ